MIYTYLHVFFFNHDSILESSSPRCFSNWSNPCLAKNLIYKEHALLPPFAFYLVLQGEAGSNWHGVGIADDKPLTDLYGMHIVASRVSEISSQRPSNS